MEVPIERDSSLWHIIDNTLLDMRPGWNAFAPRRVSRLAAPASRAPRPASRRVEVASAPEAKDHLRRVFGGQISG